MSVAYCTCIQETQKLQSDAETKMSELRNRDTDHLKVCWFAENQCTSL